MTTEQNNSENEELMPKTGEEIQENIEIQSSTENNESTVIPDEKVISEVDLEEENDSEQENIPETKSANQLLSEMEKIVNEDNAGEKHKIFNQLKERISQIINEETEDKKLEAAETGNPEEKTSGEHPLLSKLTVLTNIYKEKYDNFVQKQEAEHGKNLEKRQEIIEKLKNLYTNTEPGTNLFKAIREIKEEWSNAGQVAKSEFKLLNNNYFHHLNQFYAMLDMNKEYLEQEYAHNLEKRQHIIERAKELQNEPVVQKALNELQYLHKLWKEEAEPVAEEFREKTWDEFKDISNKIHERKAELSAVMEAEQNANLEKKNQIIAEIEKIASPEKEPNHNYWQQAIKKVEDLRSEFLKTGSVPRKISNQNWTEFKQTLRTFNTKKNDFYKNLKGSQVGNLEAKQRLIQTAKDNMNSEDWETTVPLFKKLQDEWKNIGHVPRSHANTVWEEFREACNTFFNNFREKNNATTDNWKENYKQKKALLDELKAIVEEGSVEKIEQIKSQWNAIGKVPREKISINTEFNKALREKLRLNRVSEFDIKEEGLSENQITDKARKIKNQIADLEAEISKLENNLSFFSKPNRDNPLLKDTYQNLDYKKAQLENLKQNLHNIISGE